MLEGPAGTSKTRPTCQLVHAYCDRVADTRILIVRKTRASLTESVLNTFQRITLAGHPAAEGADPSNRSHYDYPNGSRVVAGGLDTPERTFSTEYNIIWVEEAAEITEDEAQMLLRALRWHKGPKRRQIIYTTNPGAPTHWLNVRANEGKITRLVGHYEDNPRWWDADAEDWTPEGREYIGILDQMTGVRYLRLRKGIWAGAEGMVYESQWDPQVNVIDPRSPEVPRDRDGKLAFKYYVVGVDWGFTEPGVFQVWGVDNDGRMFLVREFYRVEMLLGPREDGKESWASVAREIDKEYAPDAWICDPSRPEHIGMLRVLGVPCKDCDNKRESGIEAVRRRLVKAGDGKPRLFVLSNALDRREPSIVSKGKPCGFIEEMPQYTYFNPPNERPTDDRTDPKCADHAMDAARYAVSWVDRHHVEEKPQDGYPPWSCGDVMGHEDLV